MQLDTRERVTIAVGISLCRPADLYRAKSKNCNITDDSFVYLLWHCYYYNAIISILAAISFLLLNVIIIYILLSDTYDSLINYLFILLTSPDIYGR